MEYYIFRDKKFEIKEEDKNKYIVVACARQENDYIIEWVEHYLKLGFDKIFIADNNDMGDDSLEVLLKDYVAKGLVEIFDLRGYEKIQVLFYNMFSQRGHYKWCAYFDCDEFLELNAHDNIKIFMNENHSNDSFVRFNWVMYSNHNEIEKNNLKLQEKYIHPLPLICAENFIKKTMLNGNYKVAYDIHGPINEIILWETPTNYKEGYLKHYKYKSLEEQFAKQNRGSVARGKNVNINGGYKLFNYDEIYFSIINKLHNLRGAFKKTPIDEIYEVISYNFSEQHMVIIFHDIVNEMLNKKNKYFVIKNDENKFPDYWFNILFEYALHTQNKIALRMPSLTHNYKYYNYTLK